MNDIDAGDHLIVVVEQNAACFLSFQQEIRKDVIDVTVPLPVRATVEVLLPPDLGNVNTSVRKVQDAPGTAGVDHTVMVGMNMGKDDVVDVGRFEIQAAQPVEHVALWLHNIVRIARQVAEKVVPMEHVVEEFQILNVAVHCGS